MPDEPLILLVEDDENDALFAMPAFKKAGMTCAVTHVSDGEEAISRTEAMDTNMTKTKGSIVFCHGIWADGSCFNKVIPTLQSEGYEVMSAQYGLDTNESDVAAVKRTLGRVSNPTILVGHSYGGSVITGAGTDERVAGLVYITALAPDAGETSQSFPDKFPASDIFSHIEVADGRVWIKPEGVKCFAGDLPEEEQKVV